MPTQLPKLKAGVGKTVNIPQRYGSVEQEKEHIERRLDYLHRRTACAHWRRVVPVATGHAAVDLGRCWLYCALRRGGSQRSGDGGLHSRSVTRTGRSGHGGCGGCLGASASGLDDSVGGKSWFCTNGTQHRHRCRGPATARYSRDWRDHFVDTADTVRFAYPVLHVSPKRSKPPS